MYLLFLLALAYCTIRHLLPSFVALRCITPSLDGPNLNIIIVVLSFFKCGPVQREHRFRLDRLCRPITFTESNGDGILTLPEAQVLLPERLLGGCKS